MIPEERNGYRITSGYDPNEFYWVIEKDKGNGDWGLCFRVNSYKEGLNYLDNPELIERKMNLYLAVLAIVLIIFAACIIPNIVFNI